MQIEHNGRTQSATAWAKEIGITYHVLRWRLKHWPLETALTTPKQPHGRFRGTPMSKSFSTGGKDRLISQISVVSNSDDSPI